MSFWSSQILEKRLPTLVSDFERDRVDCNAYTLRVGSEVYVSPISEDQDSASRTIRSLENNEAFTIPPGQFAYLITEETVKIPLDAMAFISVKAKIKFRGLVNVSGFHVDPGYDGKLIFSVYNAGPATIHLRQGQNCFLIWFADLAHQSEKHKRGADNSFISSDLINSAPGELKSLESLSAKIKLVEKDITDRMSKIEARQSSIDTRTAGTFTLACALLGGAILLLLRLLVQV